mmetsp:Transcript_129689/g.416009  ORF Transcript_129689/g.416009 Transcript_129689/m.416009 type:complete len:236 (+) Transcript_129689:243-950(+)
MPEKPSRLMQQRGTMVAPCDSDSTECASLLICAPSKSDAAQCASSLICQQLHAHAQTFALSQDGDAPVERVRPNLTLRRTEELRVVLKPGTLLATSQKLDLRFQLGILLFELLDFVAQELMLRMNLHGNCQDCLSASSQLGLETVRPIVDDNQSRMIGVCLARLLIQNDGLFGRFSTNDIATRIIFCLAPLVKLRSTIGGSDEVNDHVVTPQHVLLGDVLSRLLEARSGGLGLVD